ncbi:MAG: DNRLRE domain-containing protein [Deltaproteobacteria bacterium]|nr:DNRLRE domain-containing protein [Deltaproteobacteria bacterium]
MALVEQELILSAVADTWLNSNQPNQTHGSSFELQVDSGPAQSSLVRFDVTAIPTTATVTLAELTVTTSNDPGGACTVHRVLESWVEGEATHNDRAANTPWLAAGASPPSTASVPSGSLAPDSPNTPIIASLATASVQDWVTDPSTNFGLGIATVSSDTVRLRSRENVVMIQRPRLRVRFRP